MALTKAQKTVQLEELKGSLQKAQSTVFVHYIGMTVTDASDFRRQLRQNGAEMKVAKKTLMRLAAKEMDLPELPEDQLNGPVACIFSYDDPLVGAQVALKFSKAHPQVGFLGGFFEGKLLSKDEAKGLATIPTRPILLATFAMMIRSPLVSFASMVNSPLTGFARALSELGKKGGMPGAPAAPVAEAPAAETPAAHATTPEKAPTVDATGDPIDPDTGGRTEVVLAEELNEPSHAVTENDTEAAPEGSFTEAPPEAAAA
ncbi:MAG: large subunit ribosomal protein [Candidatus Peribacteria bacterium]|nr:large subunit ribosomal protein [Candidatus Peribacteria bacterium]